MEPRDVLESLHRSFAPPHAPPALLLRWAGWLASDAAWGLPLRDFVGGDDGQWPSRLNDHWIAEGSDLADRFAIFMSMTEGSSVALWNAGGAPEGWPVVLIGSEGAAVVLADSLAGFLATIAVGRFEPVGDAGATDRFDWQDFRTEAEVAPEDDWSEEELDEARAARDARGAMGRWLAGETGVADINALCSRRTPPGALGRHFDAHVREVDLRRAADPDWQALIAMMPPFVERARERETELTATFAQLGIAPDLVRGAQRLATCDFAIAGAGEELYLGELVAGTPVRLEVEERARPHLLALRERRARRNPALGLWFTATLRCRSALRGSGFDLIARHREAPDERMGALPPAAIRADLLRLPPSLWWRSEWHARFLG